MPWVTINGHHVLVNEDGEPTRPEDKKFLAGNNKPKTGSKAHYTKIKEWEDKLEKAETTEDIDRLKDDINDYTRDTVNKDRTLDDRDRNHIESRMRDLYSAANRRADSFEGKDTQKEDKQVATIKNPGGRTRIADKALEERQTRAEYSGKESKADKISSGKKYAIQKQQDTDAKLHYNKTYNNLSKSEQKMIDKNIKKYHPEWYK